MLEMMLAIKPPTGSAGEWEQILDIDFSTDGMIKDKVTGGVFSLGTGVTVANGQASFTGAGNAVLSNFGSVDFVGCEVEIDYVITAGAGNSVAIFELGRIEDNTTSLGFQYNSSGQERFVNDVTTSTSSWYDTTWTRATGTQTYKVVRVCEKPTARLDVYRGGQKMGSVADVFGAGFYRDPCSLSLGGLFRGDYRFTGSISKLSIRKRRIYPVITAMMTSAIRTYTPPKSTYAVCFIKGPGGGGGAGGNQSLSYKYPGGNGGNGGLIPYALTMSPTTALGFVGGTGGAGGQNVNSRVDSGNAGIASQLTVGGASVATALPGNGGAGSATNQGGNGANGGNGMGNKGGKGGYRADGTKGDDGAIVIRYVDG